MNIPRDTPLSMSPKIMLAAAVILLLVAIATGLLFNDMVTIGVIPLWVKEYYLHIWVPIVLGILGVGLAFRARQNWPKSETKSDTKAETKITTDSKLTPPMSKDAAQCGIKNTSDDVPINRIS